jgi:hypothetical protein
MSLQITTISETYSIRDVDILIHWADYGIHFLILTLPQKCENIIYKMMHSEDNRLC